MRGKATARNAVRHTVVDYVGDPFGARTARAFADWGRRAQAGLLSQATLGLDDPSKRLTGYVERPVQHFTGAAAVANPLQYRNGGNQIEDNLSGDGMGDPARRIFAERLRRRQ